MSANVSRHHLLVTGCHANCLLQRSSMRSWNLLTSRYLFSRRVSTAITSGEGETPQKTEHASQLVCSSQDLDWREGEARKMMTWDSSYLHILYQVELKESSLLCSSCSDTKQSVGCLSDVWNQPVSEHAVQWRSLLSNRKMPDCVHVTQPSVLPGMLTALQGHSSSRLHGDGEKSNIHYSLHRC